MSKIVLYNSADVPATPPAGQLVFFAKDKQLYTINDEGTTSGPGANPEYRWSTWFPLEGGAQLLQAQISPMAEQTSYGLPVSDPNAGSIVRLSVNIMYNGNDPLDGGVTRNFELYVGETATGITVAIPAGETGIFSSDPSQTASVAYEDLVSIQSMDESGNSVSGIASITFSSAPVPA